ncbi:MauE/DoxX family redox-associated membrane protein [Nocardioides bizhenqiangii]|uniref:MauE/DoxX family redox-associated membrane protein n=1 Tax=Nocardioides bizhenqiangii TaxID=3095076 RepID=A0ABZ0ZUK5_9ACTN|nr:MULTISPECIES: MauE/DoxX family redox-associated membrane protein [unclassified Nocardioides]MDZ5623426.1 MauE/DoxX family redox-associated membrane protein [Nocardioides sp. HM23]WQQ27750.1 MauE/DoxX family redox-associated membrane protein [Nocardioides sp. HM61]
MEGRAHAWLGLIARLLTGGVWIVAGALKVTDPAASIAAVRAYELLPGSLVEPVGYALPAVELVVGVALVLGAFTRGAAVVSALLFVAFIIGIASVWARGIEIDCGCFGGGGPKEDAASSYPWEIARDVALLIASLYLVVVRRTRLAVDNLLFPTRATGAEVPDPDPVEQGS